MPEDAETPKIEIIREGMSGLLARMNGNTPAPGILNVEKLDDMVVKHGMPKYIKIDVEGFELKVLNGLSKMPDFLSFEYVSEFHDQAKMCMDYIKSKDGNVKFNFTKDLRFSFVFDEWVDGETLLDYLKKSDNSVLTGDIFASSNLA